MPILSSVSENAHVPMTVCVGNVSVIPILEPDITDENEVDVRKAPVNPSTVETEQDDYEKDIQPNTKLMSPPSWVPSGSSPRNVIGQSVWSCDR